MSGTGIWLGDPTAARAVQARGLDAVEASGAEVRSAVIDSAWAGQPGSRISNWWNRQGDSPSIDADQANERFGIPGVLTFDRPVTEAAAQALREGREAEQRRQAIIARRPDTLGTSGAARLALTFGTAILDPVNVGLALIPVVGQARMGLLLGTSSRTALRAATGAAEGVIGMALLEPVEYALARDEFNDRTMADTLAALAFGAVLGGGLHVLGGAAKDVITGRRATPIERAVGDAPAPVREAALRGALAAVVEGRPVAVGSLFDLPTATSYRPVTGQAAEGFYAAFTPGGQRIEARPQVVDLASLTPSHMADGSVNPLYPHAEGLQPRDRTTAGSQDQIQTIAANLQPERLGPSAEAGSGAPIVNADGVVESGNGRVAALERVYASPELAHRAQAYRAYLEAQGHDLTGIERPVLVGRRMTELAPQEARSFARGANERSNLGMSAAEQARADADRAGRAVDQLMPGQLTSGQNRDFTRSFLAQLPAEERGPLLLADGRLSAMGEQRLRQAVLAHSFGDGLGPLLEKLLNGEADNLKGIAGALADSAGPWGRMRAAAARGKIAPDLDITVALGEAVQIVEQARRVGRSIADVLAQTDAFAAPPGPATLAMLRLMHRDDGLTRAMGREPLAELLTRYSDEAMKVAPGLDMFGTPPASPADLLRAAMRHIDPAAATARALDDLARAPRVAPEDVQASREVARMAAAEPARAGSEARGATAIDPATATARALDDLARAPRVAPEDVQASREVARMAAEKPLQEPVVVKSAQVDPEPTTAISEEAAGRPLQEIVSPIDRSASPQEKLRQLEALTEENRPLVAKIIAEIDRALGTRSGDNAKASKAILSKASRPTLLARKPWHDVEHIRDSYRFKTVVQSLDQVGAALKIVLEAGLKLVKIDTIKVFEPAEWGWRIAAFDLRMPNGQLVEWYLPIAEMERAKKEAGHQLFENWRNKTPGEQQAQTLEYMSDLNKSRDLYEGAFQAALGRMGFVTEADAKAAFDASVARAFETNRKLSDTSSAWGNLATGTSDASRQPSPGSNSQPLAGPAMMNTRPVSRSSSATGAGAAELDASDMGASDRKISAAEGGSNARISPELAALTAQADDITRQLEALPLRPDEQAQLRAMRDGVQAADSEARATEQAALCLAGVR